VERRLAFTYPPVSLQFGLPTRTLSLLVAAIGRAAVEAARAGWHDGTETSRIATCRRARKAASRTLGHLGLQLLYEQAGFATLELPTCRRKCTPFYTPIRVTESRFFRNSRLSGPGFTRSITSAP